MRSGDMTLPDFIVIGAFKSGTTSLMSYLSQHPSIYTPWMQEPNFFGNDRFSLETGGDPSPVRDSIGYGRMRTETLAQYAELFRGAADGATVGESSPQYMRNPLACARMRSVIPDVKVVAVLRNPVDRAFSDYSMFVRDGLEQDDFATAIRREARNEPGHHYVHTGFYGQQLRPYFDQFPREQISVFLYEDLARPDQLLRSLFTWLGVDPDFQADVSDMRNVSGVPRNRLISTGYKLRRRLQPVLKPIVPPRMQKVLDHQLRRGLRREAADPQSRAHLVDVYADDVAELERMIGRDLSPWQRLDSATT